ncbi:MAG: cobalamin biosynthesis bifunctional protein CbiET, partial [Lentisphaeria bacterium]|nr:cobalamin biosynthesis bifunctional protein CbiET [Lentisphaeria bacterium]
RVFVGGGGAGLEGILRGCFERLKPGGVMVVTAVLAESAATLAGVLAPDRSEFLTVNVSRGTALGGQTLMRAENPITIAVYRKPMKEES